MWERIVHFFAKGMHGGLTKQKQVMIFCLLPLLSATARWNDLERWNDGPDIFKWSEHSCLVRYRTDHLGRIEAGGTCFDIKTISIKIEVIATVQLEARNTGLSIPSSSTGVHVRWSIAWHERSLANKQLGPSTITIHKNSNIRHYFWGRDPAISLRSSSRPIFHFWSQRLSRSVLKPEIWE